MNVAGKTIVKNSPLAGKGLFASTKIKKGSKIGTLKGFITRKEHPHCLWISDKRALRVTNKYRYSNHDWISPNAKLRGYTLFAIKTINPGEEILWDYSCGYNYANDFDKKKPIFDNNGLAVIHCAISNDNISLVKKCLKKSPSLLFLRTKQKIAGSFTLAPIFYAINMGSKKSILFLSKNKKVGHLKTEDGHNLLHWAFVMAETNWVDEETEQLLIKRFTYLLKKPNKYGYVPYQIWFDLITERTVKNILSHLNFNQIEKEFKMLTHFQKKKFLNIANKLNLKIKSKDKSKDILKCLRQEEYELSLLF